MALTNKQIIEKANEAFENADTEAFLSYCADNFVWNMLGNEVWNGKESIRQAMKGMPPEPPEFTVKELIGEQDIVVCYGNMKMKNKEGNKEDYSFCDVYHLKNGAITELITYLVKLTNDKKNQ